MADAPIDGVDVQKEFENTMLQYAQIRNEPLLDIEKYVVIGNEVSKIMIGGKSLKELIKGVEDNDLKKFVMAIFVYETIQIYWIIITKMRILMIQYWKKS